MANKLIVSLSPHVHGGDTVSKNMYGVLIALIPAFIVSIAVFGVGAFIVTLTSVAACIFFEWAITKYILKRDKTTILDGSAALTGVLLAFNLPSNFPIWMIIIGALVAIGVGKMTFGGLGCNVFNPALIGRVFLLISFPVAMTSWPQTGQYDLYTDAVTGATPLAIVKAALASNGTEAASGATAQGPQSVSEILAAHGITVPDMLYGNMGGSLGEVAAIALLIGFAYMLLRKIITWHIPVAIFATVIVFTGILHLANPEQFAGPLFHLFTGGLMLGAIFMATDYVTSPMTHKGMWIYGIGIGVLTVLIRVFGSYPEGMSFAILIMNGLTPLINRCCKPQKF